MNKIDRKCGAKVQTDSVELGLYETEREDLTVMGLQNFTPVCQ